MFFTCLIYSDENVKNILTLYLNSSIIDELLEL